MPSTPLRFTDSIDTEALRPVVYEGLVLGAMLVVLGFALLLPGVDRTVPSTAMTFQDVILATGSAAIIVWLAHAAPAVAALTRSVIAGPDRVVQDAGRIAAAVVVFFAVLIGYRGLYSIAVPTFVSADSVWAYDLAFFVVGLGPLLVITNRLRRNLEVLTDQVVAIVSAQSSSGDTSARELP